MEQDRFVSMEEICSYLGLSRDTIKKLVKQKGMPAYKVDRKWKFKIAEINAWMATQNKIIGD